MSQTGRQGPQGAEALGAQHLLPRAAQILDEPGVVHRNRRLTRDSLEQRPVPRREASAGTAVVDRERPQQAPLLEQRNHQHPLRPRPLEERRDRLAHCGRPDESAGLARA
jgi:hypothetical protein